VPDIYDQHKAAFASVSAFVVMAGAERVATVALKFPRDGAGRLYAYVHLLGVPMVRAFASGYGYDKRSAAVSAAIARIPAADPAEYAADAAVHRYRSWLKAAAPKMDSCDWTRALEGQGFTVLQAV
jgi:hypothetical protein